MDEALVLRWRIRKGREVPVIEKATAQDKRYMLSRPTKRQLIEGALKGCRRRLEEARKSVAANEQHITDLEIMLSECS